ncbi:MAG: REP-associated tyrosine transposase [Calditrichota bacterium]
MLQRHTKLAFSGSVHFITTVTAVRGNWFIEPDLCRNLLMLFEGYRERHNVRCLGYVLMPDHLHALLHQDNDSPVIPRLLDDFKSVSSRQYRPKSYPTHHLWAKRYDDVPIPNVEAARTRLEYMHNNPVRRGISEQPQDYPWSSAKVLMGYEGESVVALSQI